MLETSDPLLLWWWRIRCIRQCSNTPLEDHCCLTAILTPLKMRAVPDFRGSPLSVPLSAPYTSGQTSVLRFSLKSSFRTDGKATRGTQCGPPKPLSQLSERKKLWNCRIAEEHVRNMKLSGAKAAGVHTHTQCPLSHSPCPEHIHGQPGVSSTLSRAQPSAPGVKWGWIQRNRVLGELCVREQECSVENPDWTFKHVKLH